MDRATAKAELKTREPDFLEVAKKKVNGAPTYICPACNNGAGKNGDGIALDPTGKNGKKWKCFSCGMNEDIIGLWKLHTGISDDREAFEGLYSYFNITVDSSRPTAQEAFGQYQKQAKNEQYTATTIHTNAYTQQAEQAPTDFTDFYLQAYSNIEATDYWRQRGLSKGIVDRFRLGYVAEWRQPLETYLRGGNGLTSSGKPRTRETWEYIPLTPRLIIPITKYSYLARDIRQQIPPEQEDYKKSKVKGAERVSWTYNSKALKTASKPIFIVEGELDALSLIEVGAEAIALGSIAYIRAFIELVKKIRPSQPLLIALDNETEPEKQARIDQAATDLEAGFKELELPYYRLEPAQVAGQHKDANEALVADRKAFEARVDAIYQSIQQEQEVALEAEKQAYLNTSTASYLQDFINGIAESVNTPYTPTGFTNLDKLLDGGLYEGLYFCGAISSLGKTTLMLQICDQIAQAGGDVLIFSLEMARNELISKSISRQTLLDVLQNKGDIRNAKTARGVTCGLRYQKYSQTEKDLIQRSITAYSQYADHIYIYEGVGDMGVDQVREKIQKHISFTGRKPTVLIDYVQILAPADVRASDKQNTDKAVLELKRISRDYKLPIIAVSSLNRDNYKGKINMAAFKESGAIEYGSDVLIGLQLKGADQKNFDVDEAKSKNPREIELVILKNRNGATGGKIEYEYYPLFNYFKEV